MFVDCVLVVYNCTSMPEQGRLTRSFQPSRPTWVNRHGIFNYHTISVHTLVHHYNVGKHGVFLCCVICTLTRKREHCILSGHWHHALYQNCVAFVQYEATVINSGNIACRADLEVFWAPRSSWFSASRHDRHEVVLDSLPVQSPHYSPSRLREWHAIKFHFLPAKIRFGDCVA